MTLSKAYLISTLYIYPFKFEQEVSSIAIFVISEHGDEDIALSTSLRYYVKPLQKWQALYQQL